jgi:hypothetical protein
MTDVMTDAETCRLPNYADPATQLISKNYTTYVDEFVDAMTAGGAGPDILCTDSVQLQSVGFRVWYISTVNRSFTNENASSIARSGTPNLYHDINFDGNPNPSKQGQMSLLFPFPLKRHWFSMKCASSRYGPLSVL